MAKCLTRRLKTPKHLATKRTRAGDGNFRRIKFPVSFPDGFYDHLVCSLHEAQIFTARSGGYFRKGHVRVYLNNYWRSMVSGGGGGQL